MTQSNGSLYYIIPSQVMDDSNLDHTEVVAYALLSGLAAADGKCFPSDEWLEKKLGMKERRIQYILQKLQKVGYITRETIPRPGNPFKKDRIIHINHFFKKSLPDAPPCGSEVAPPCALESHHRADIISKEELISEKERRHPSADLPQEALDAAKKLRENIKTKFPKIKEPKLDSWVQEIERLHRIDGKGWEEIDAMISWIKDNPFWCKQILSGGNLRKHFDKMSVQRTEPEPVHPDREANKKLALDARKILLDAGELDMIKIYNSSVYCVSRKESITYDMNPEDFKKILMKYFKLVD